MSPLAASETDRGRARALMAAGWTAPQIARQLGRSKAWVYDVGREMRSSEGVAAITLGDIRRLTEAGFSAAWIAWILDMPVKRITQIRSLYRWRRAADQPERLYMPPRDGQGWAQKEKRLEPRRPPVKLRVIQDTDGPLPVAATPQEAERERDLWCRRANRCLSAITAARVPWRAFSCRACAIRGTEQESREERLRGIALAREWMETRRGEPDREGEE